MLTLIRTITALSCFCFIASSTSGYSPTISADLAASALYSAWQASPGDRIDVSFTVTNIGDAASESCYWGVYISSGSYYTGTRIASGSIYSMDPDNYRSYGGSGEVPEDLEPGYYYLYAVADDGDYVSDSDRSNNVVYTSFQVLEPDQVKPSSRQPSR